MDLFACEGEEHAYGGDAGTRALLQTRGDTDLAELARCAGYVARIQRPACIEKRAVTIQNRCRWLRGVESLELQEVARTTGPARMCETAVTKTRG